MKAVFVTRASNALSRGSAQLKQITVQGLCPAGHDYLLTSVAFSPVGTVGAEECALGVEETGVLDASLTETATRIVEVPRILLAIPDTTTAKESSP